MVLSFATALSCQRVNGSLPMAIPREVTGVTKCRFLDRAAGPRHAAPLRSVARFTHLDAGALLDRLDDCGQIGVFAQFVAGQPE